MSAIADIFAAVHLDLQTGQFEVDAAKIAGTVGDSMSKTLNSKLKSAAVAGIGALGGMAFSAALAGANQLDAAMRKLQADTGMSADEAKRAEGAIAGMYQHNLQGIDQIGATMAVVINGLDLTGTAADAMTAKFLAFETATGQDSAAVSAFHEILNAWNLDASSAAEIMDQLVASHQKYGGSLADNEASLQRLAPQMIAMGMTIEDTIALLNLFDAAGLDASKAQFALNQAVKNLKPGQTFNDLVKQVSSVEDPLQRAQLAITIFGARGGVGLANVLKPGITGLQDFGFAAQDVAGKTEQAAAAVQSGFGAQATLLIHNFVGALSDLATNFGPLLMLAAVAGPRFMSLLLAGLGAGASLMVPKIIAPLLAAAGVNGAWMTTGTMIGTIISAAASTAMFLAVPVAIGGFLLLARDEWKKQTASWGFNTPDLFTGQGPLAPNAGIQPVGPQLSPEEQAKVAADFLAAGTAAGAALTTGVTTGIAQGTPSAAMAADVFASMVGGAAKRSVRVGADQVVAVFGTTLVAGVKNAARATGIEGMLALAAGITSARQAPLDAFDAMVEMLKTPMTSTQEAARLAGELTSQSLADGLRSHDPEIHAQAIAVKREILARLEELQTAKGIGSAAMAELVKGMESKDPEIRKAAGLAYDAVMDRLNATKADAYTSGVNAATAFGDGFTAAARAKLTKIGINVGVGTLGGRDAGGPVAAGMPVIVGERRPELFVPDRSGYILPSVPAGRGVSVNIENVEIRDAHDEFSLTQQLRFLAAVTA